MSGQFWLSGLVYWLLTVIRTGCRVFDPGPDRVWTLFFPGGHGLWISLNPAGNPFPGSRYQANKCWYNYPSLLRQLGEFVLIRCLLHLIKINSPNIKRDRIKCRVGTVYPVPPKVFNNTPKRGYSIFLLKTLFAVESTNFHPFRGRLCSLAI